jgi:hypothetical protein
VTERRIGDLIDSLGVLAEIADGDMVPSAVVLLKAVDEKGQVGVTIASSEGLSWLDQLGLIEAAKQIATAAGYRAVGDDS